MPDLARAQRLALLLRAALCQDVCESAQHARQVIPPLHHNVSVTPCGSGMAYLGAMDVTYQSTLQCGSCLHT